MIDPHGHHHQHHGAPHRAAALAPGWSLLRLSGAQRLAIAGAAIAMLWGTLALLLGWTGA
ncbi:MAG: hypothetical protein MEP57_09405 [Microvirga sp.]|nr:hypothetical protein [Microvirga sp.]